MSNLEAICAKIQQDAEAEAAGIRQAAADALEARCREAEEKARYEAERQIHYAREKAEPVREQMIAHASLSARDLVLSAKQSLISRVMTEAEARLRQRSGAELAQSLKKALDGQGLGPGDALILPPDAAMDLPAGIPVERDPKLRSGFALRRGGIIEKHDYVELLEVLREELETGILRQLREQVAP